MMLWSALTWLCSMDRCLIHRWLFFFFFPKINIPWEAKGQTGDDEGMMKAWYRDELFIIYYFVFNVYLAQTKRMKKEKVAEMISKWGAMKNERWKIERLSLLSLQSPERGLAGFGARCSENSTMSQYVERSLAPSTEHKMLYKLVSK